MSSVTVGVHPHQVGQTTEPVKLLNYSWKQAEGQTFSDTEVTRKFLSWDDAIKRAQEEAFKALQQKSMVEPWLVGPTATQCQDASFESVTLEDVDTVSLRSQLKFVRDIRVHPFEELPEGGGESVGAFANRQAVRRYTQKVEHKRQRARELRKVKRKREMGTDKEKGSPALKPKKR